MSQYAYGVNLIETRGIQVHPRYAILDISEIIASSCLSLSLSLSLSLPLSLEEIIILAGKY